MEIYGIRETTAGSVISASGLSGTITTSTIGSPPTRSMRSTRSTSVESLRGTRHSWFRTRTTEWRSS